MIGSGLNAEYLGSFMSQDDMRAIDEFSAETEIPKEEIIGDVVMGYVESHKEEIGMIIYDEVKKYMDRYRKEHKKETNGIPDNFYARRTIFMTFEQGAALDIIARERGLTKTEVTMMVFDAALEQIESGIMERVKVIAQRDRERDFKALPEAERKKYLENE